jgi:hypothetical protein
MAHQIEIKRGDRTLLKMQRETFDRAKHAGYYEGIHQAQKEQDSVDVFIDGEKITSVEFTSAVAGPRTCG